MEKEKLFELFNRLSPEDKFEVMKSIRPEFCQSMRKDPRLMQEMMKSMMASWGKGMGAWMGMMKG